MSSLNFLYLNFLYGFKGSIPGPISTEEESKVPRD